MVTNMMNRLPGGGQPDAASTARGFLLILVLSILIKLWFMWFLGGRVYFDVVRDVNFGYLVDSGVFSIRTHFVNSKTFVGPLMWFRLYHAFGVTGMNLFNLLVVTAVSVVQYRFMRSRYSSVVCVTACALTAFYVGTNRNAIAGEPSDNVAALLSSVGLFSFAATQSVIVPALLLGTAVIFKFWGAIFAAGFGFHLLVNRRWRDACLAGLCVLAPFIAVNFADGFESTRAFFGSLAVQTGLTSWLAVGTKLVSTGMLVTFAASAWAWRRAPSEEHDLFFTVFAAYFAYVLLNRDAWAMTFVMMLCLVFASPLVAQLLQPYLISRRRLALAVLAYLVATTAITHHNLYRDTQPLVLIDSKAECERNFGPNGGCAAEHAWR